MSYLVKVLVGPKEGVLDSEANGMKEGLESLGFKDIREFHIERYFRYTTEQKTERDARREAEEISAKYLVDSVNNGYKIVSIEEVKE